MRDESEAQRRARERHEQHMASVRAVQRRGQLQRVETKIGSQEFRQRHHGAILTDDERDQMAELHRQRTTLRRELGDEVQDDGNG